MDIELVLKWMLYFYIYCFLGWIWESSYVSIKEKNPVNRGFMKGPLLPIYGSGAICVLLVTVPFRGNNIAMALIGMTAATVLEYVTGAVMEALFRVRYWDYSTEFMNLNGYVCLKSTLCWGVMTFLMVYVIQPPIARLVDQLSADTVKVIDCVVTVTAAVDFITSFKTAIDFRNMLIKAEKMKEELRLMQQKLDGLESQLAEFGSAKKEQLAEFGSAKKEQLAEFGSAKKEQLAEFGSARKEQLVEFGSAKKEQLAEFGSAKKEQLVEFGSAKKEQLAEFGSAKKEQLVGFGSAKKEQLAGFGSVKKEQIAEFGSTKKEQLVGFGSAKKEQLQELFEKGKQEVQKQRQRMESLRGEYTDDMMGMLKRNPGTVSKRHQETLADMKKQFENQKSKKIR